MISDEKIKEYQKLLKKGTPAGEIKEMLLHGNYTEEDIQKVFAPRPYNMKTWYLVTAVIFLILGIRIFLDGNNVLLLIFSGAMFLQYFREDNRLKKQHLSDTDAAKYQDKDNLVS